MDCNVKRAKPIRSRTCSVVQLSGQHWPGPQNPALELAVPARPTGQMALSADRNLPNTGTPNNSEAPREAGWI
eukprot:15220062-Alexandrium_andersonii.AAC.1